MWMRFKARVATLSSVHVVAKPMPLKIVFFLPSALTLTNYHWSDTARHTLDCDLSFSECAFEFHSPYGSAIPAVLQFALPVKLS